jgi:hypothetical protein
VEESQKGYDGVVVMAESMDIVVLARSGIVQLNGETGVEIEEALSCANMCGVRVWR